MTSYHAEKCFGMFAEGIPVDLQGYAHTTPLDWASAPMDWGPDLSPDDWEPFWQRCKELADRAREEIATAERLLARWQIENARGRYVIPPPTVRNRPKMAETA